MQEKSKALGYIASNQRLTEQALEVMDEEAALRPPDNINEIHIKIVRCAGLEARREGMCCFLESFKSFCNRFYYCPRSEASDGYVFTGVCHSVTERGGRVKGQPPLPPARVKGQPPPPWPGSKVNHYHLRPGSKVNHPPPAPPGQHLPSPRELESMCGWYASYWIKHKLPGRVTFATTLSSRNLIEHYAHF